MNEIVINVNSSSFLIEISSNKSHFHFCFPNDNHAPWFHWQEMSLEIIVAFSLFSISFWLCQCFEGNQDLLLLVVLFALIRSERLLVLWFLICVRYIPCWYFSHIMANINASQPKSAFATTKKRKILKDKVRLSEKIHTKNIHYIKMKTILYASQTFTKSIIAWIN